MRYSEIRSLRLITFLQIVFSVWLLVTPIHARADYTGPSPVFVAIPDCESGNGTPGSGHQFDSKGKVLIGVTGDIGAYQISPKWISVANKLGMDIYSLQGNTEFAAYLFKKYGSEPWNSSSKCRNAELAGEET